MIPALLVLMALGAQDPPGFWDRDSLTGDAGSVRPELAKAGVTFTLELTAEVISNVHGGLQRDTGVDTLLDWVIDADLNKAVGWGGGSARINPMWLAGDGLAGDVGDITLVSNINGRGGARVFEAWLQQSLFDDGFSLRGGILAADQEFAITTGGLLYYNSVFGGPVFLSANVPWPIYPVGAVGLRAKVNLSKEAYVQVAVYDGNPGSEDFNRTGVRIRFDSGDGAFWITEAGWKSPGELPTSLKAGLFHHTQKLPGFTTTAERPLTGGYALAEQRLAPGVDAFVRLGCAQTNRAFVPFGMDGGINLTGLIPGRPQDVLGLGVIYARASEDFAESQPDRPLWGYEAVVELTYKLVLSPWWNFQPDVQVVIHPGGSTSIPDAVVVGIRLDLFF